MIHHGSVEVSDLERSGRFYDSVVGALGWRRHVEEDNLIGWGIVKPVFYISSRHPLGPGGCSMGREGLEPSTDGL